MIQSTQGTQLPWPVQVVIVLGVLIMLVAALAIYWPLGTDYLNYHRAARLWLQGDTRLYDHHALGFYNAPWTILLLIPVGLVPERTGEALIITTSVIGLVTVIDLFRRERHFPAYVVVLAIANLHLLDLMIRGQVDGIVLIGIGLGWWAFRTHRPLILGVALCLLGIKPFNVMLPGLLFLYAVRGWPRRDLALVFTFPALAVFSSPLIAGLDWPRRYLDFLELDPISQHRSVAIWRIAAHFGVPAWILVPPALMIVGALIRMVLRDGLTWWTLALAITTNLLVSYYANGYHYLLITPALLFVGARSRWWLFAAYLATFTPLLRIIDGTITHWDYLYPLILYTALWVLGPEPASVETWPPQNAKTQPAEL